MVDLATLDTTAASDSGAELILEHPITGKALGTVLVLAGVDSAVFNRAQNAVAEKRLRQRGKKVTPESFEKDALDILARCTLSWRDVVVDGETLPCNHDNAVILYERFPWIKEQAQTFLNDRANYLSD